MISNDLGIAKSTLSYWFKDRPFQPNYEVLKRIQYGPIKSGELKHKKKLEDIDRLLKVGKKEIGLLSKRDLWMLGIGLYIGEGSKTIEDVRLTSSDPKIIALSIKWLREICDLAEENLRATLHLYPDTDLEKSLSYWQDITGLPASNFYKTSIDRRIDKKTNNHGKLPYGTIQIRVKSNGDSTKGVNLFRRINGWVEGVWV